MPVATPFTALGRGNGFPYKLTKVDVSDRGDGQPYDYWVTLGGFKQGDAGPPTDQQISDSLANAMKLFWNYNGHSVDFTVDVDLTALTIDIEQGDFDGGNVTAPFEPEDRVCEEDGWFVFIQDPSGFESIDTEIYPIRMYDGSTDDEENFVGYGVDLVGFDAFSLPASFLFASYIDTISVGSTYEYSDALDGMWFVAAAETFAGTSSINGLTATFLIDDGSGEVDVTITYKDFDFYTYP
jgi:hypothetical protein